jgi:PAS domain S-box-containing protein
MVMVNHDGEIVLVNSQAEELYGYTCEELMGRTIEMLVPEASRKSHPGLRGDYVAHAQARPMGVGRDLHAQHKNGKRRQTCCVGIGIRSSEKDRIMVVVR